MGFRTLVEVPYRDWVIQHVWNAKSDQFDRTATKGTQRVEQAAMTYQEFIRNLDLLDGRKVVPASWAHRGADPVSTPAPAAEVPAPSGPSHPSLFGESL